MSDFAGIEMPAFALSGLGVAGPHVAYEIDPVARAFIKANHHGVILGFSVARRMGTHPPVIDVITAGFPCQPYSALGLQGGWDDPKGRGDLVTFTIRAILRERPSLVVLENVAGFVRTDGGAILAWLIDKLQHDNLYKVFHKILCTSDLGLPQSRKRFYLVALRADTNRHDFVWPSKVDMLPLRSLLGSKPADAAHER